YPSKMRFIDILSLCLSLLGTYSLLLYLRFLLPRNITPSLSSLANETQQLLHRAEGIGAIPQGSVYRNHLDRSVNQLVTMRIQSNRARGTFQQLRLAIWHGLTYRLFVLYTRIEVIRSGLEVCYDRSPRPSHKS
ncbi:hypothetical protein F5148DRAFT_1250879, partial [Russula earlei]